MDSPDPARRGSVSDRDPSRPDRGAAPAPTVGVGVGVGGVVVVRGELDPLDLHPELNLDRKPSQAPGVRAYRRI